MVAGWITEAVVFVAVLLGVALRTIWPYLDKARAAEQKGEKVEFLNKFKISAIMAFLVSMISAGVAFPTVLEQIGASSMSLLAIFWFCFIYGYGTNGLANRLFNKTTHEPEGKTSPMASPTP